MTYEQFCDHLHNYTRVKGLGYTEQMLRDAPFPYADVRTRLLAGKCTIEQAEDSFAKAVRAYIMRGRQMAEAG